MVKPTLLCALTPGMRLMDWQELGTFERELEPFLHYVADGFDVRFLECARGVVPSLPRGVSVVQVPHWRLLRACAALRRDLFRDVAVVRTNQTHRADTVIDVATAHGAPSILRCGYVKGEQLENLHGRTADVVAYQQREARGFRRATLCQLPTEPLSAWVQQRYGISPTRIRVVPNFVDTTVFTPNEAPVERPLTIGAVGRLEPIKRYDLLLRSAHAAGIRRVAIAGQGSQRETLSELAATLGIELDLVGQLSHADLPAFYRSLDIFVICSECEGHPKALVEAMACGVSSIGVKVPGVRELIEPNVSGMLAEPTATAIGAAARELVKNARLRRQLGAGARRTAIAMYDKKCVLTRDAEVVKEAYGRRSS